jgi:septum formation protein
MANQISKAMFGERKKAGSEDVRAGNPSPNSGKRLVLASLSPRRKDLLGVHGIDFETIPSDFDEYIEVGMAPKQVAVHLALQKANTVKERLLSRCPIEERQAQSKNLVVLGADTIVVLGASILGKPLSKQEAFETLLLLSGKVHEVMTGVAVISFDRERNEMVAKTVLELSLVSMRVIAPAEIEAYISTSEPMDKAGAYAVQGAAAAFVEKIDGCVSNVIGLPMSKTVDLLRQAGIKILGC